jgi:hypothetical protein
MMSNTSERAKKAALTRAHRQALQALSDKKLIASASGKFFSYGAAMMVRTDNMIKVHALQK